MRKAVSQQCARAPFQVDCGLRLLLRDPVMDLPGHRDGGVRRPCGGPVLLEERHGLGNGGQLSEAPLQVV